MSAHAALIRAGFSLPIQAPFFLICDADSMGVGYHVLSFCASFSFNSMPCSGCSALHGVSPIFFFFFFNVCLYIVCITHACE